MPQSLSSIILHIIFSTKNRESMIREEIESELHAYIASICRACGSEAYRVGGTSNHIHIACTLPRTLAASQLLEEVKKSSSKWIKGKSRRYQAFSWQAGYAVFSVGRSQLDHLVRYIDGQKDHHRKKGFKEEVVKLLEKYGVEYNERYLMA